MNPDIASAKPAVLAALRKANNIVGIADFHGWPRPAAYVDALAMLNAAREAERAVTPLPAPPQKPKDIAKWIAATAEIRNLEATRRDVIDELVLKMERETAAAGLASTADYCSRLTDHFDELLAAFDAHADSPRALTGHETPEEIEAHTAALRVAGELSTALLQRAQIADAAGEAEDVGPDVSWLVIAPAPETTRDAVESALAEFKERFPQSLGEWDQLRGIGLRLAQVGEVAARRQRHSDFMWAIGHSTPEMGMRGDYTYAEIEGNPDGPAYGLARQAETDHLFDQSQSMSL